MASAIDSRACGLVREGWPKIPVGGPDETEPLEGMSKNATRSRSLDVDGRVTVEAARTEVLGLIRMSVAVFVCKHPRNRKGGREALAKAFFATLGSINHPYVSGERVTLVEMPAEEEKTRDQCRSMQSKPGRER